MSGGAGQIGSHLCRSLLESRHEVICIDNLITGDERNIAALTSRLFTFLNRDVNEDLNLSSPIDAIYHLASPASPPDYVSIPLETLEVNSRGTWNLLRLADSHRARFLFASTSEVYGDPAVHPQPEDYWGNVNPNGVRSCYDESKRFGEALTAAYVRQGKVDARTARIFNTYGPHARIGDGRMVPNFICQALRGDPLTIYGSGQQTRSLCYVRDTVRGIRLALESDISPGEVVNIGNPEERTVEEYAREIARACGTEFRPAYANLPPDDPVRRCPDISRARALIGWKPRVSLEEGLRLTVDWFRFRVTEAEAADPSTQPEQPVG